MIKVLLLITGGAIGTVFRYGVSTWVQRSMLHSFPFGILSVNVIGSFLIGFCWSIAELVIYLRAQEYFSSPGCSADLPHSLRLH